MENFTNETIDTANLPKFEAVAFTNLEPSFWKVIVLNIAIGFLILAIIIVVGYLNIIDWNNFSLLIYIAYPSLFLLILIFSRIAFIKKGYAFRTHDVLFKSGILGTNTTVIPYNRVQHVALQEGLLSRYFGLAKVEIFTAGQKDGDIAIPGIKKEQAESIKQLLMGKIQKQL